MIMDCPLVLYFMSFRTMHHWWNAKKVLDRVCWVEQCQMRMYKVRYLRFNHL